MKKSMPVAVAGGISLALGLTACGGSSGGGDEIQLRMALADNEQSNYYQGALAIADEVSERTDGRIEITVVAGGSLGDERATVEMAMNGDLDIATAANSVFTNWIPEMSILDQAYLWESADQAHAAVDGEVGDLIEEAALEQNLHVVGYMESGFRNVFSTRPVESIDDFAGLKIRTMQNEYQLAAFEGFGAVPVGLPSGEQFTALQQGTIDAVENATSNALANSYYEVAPHITNTEHTFVYIVMALSDDAWSKIPEELREPFLEGMQAGYEQQREFLVQANEEAEAELQDAGVEFYDIDQDEMRAAWEDTVVEHGWSFDPEWQDAVDTAREQG